MTLILLFGEVRYLSDIIFEKANPGQAVSVSLSVGYLLLAYEKLFPASSHNHCNICGICENFHPYYLP